MPTIKELEKVLAKITDPVTGNNIVESGLITSLQLHEGEVRCVLTIALADKNKKSSLHGVCEAALREVPGVKSVSVVLTAESAPENAPTRTPAQWNLTPITGVKKIIAVASGKGGVGKSTTTINLAHALTKLGKRVGILDADIYGPSIPRMLGLENKPQPAIKNNFMVPYVSAGIKCMSIAFITGPQAAMLRGPMITKSMQQMLRGTAWSELDYLLIDMPPGTGDITLSLCQQVPLDGAIIVTTPQEVAVMDARKCAHTFQKLGVSIIGVVENMEGEIFGQGGGANLAKELETPLLGIVSLNPEIRKKADIGEIFSGNDYAKIAEQLLSR